MREFLITWAALVGAALYGYWWRGLVDEARRQRAKAAWCPDNLPAEFKAWLHDYIALNAPRKEH